jgi:uncharacterized membrane protein YtjA (UPF0391 family)
MARLLPLSVNKFEGGDSMLNWSLTFLVVGVIAGLLGLSGLAGTATQIAWILFVVFLILYVVSLVAGRRVPPAGVERREQSLIIV